MHHNKPNFWDNVKIQGPDDCWDWDGIINRNGYGIFNVDGKYMLTPKYTWFLSYGDDISNIPKTHKKCNNRLCCNPSHFFKDEKERFLSHVKISDDPDGCWEWQGTIDKYGYGQYFFMGRNTTAHRVAWILFNGEIPKEDSYHGICVLHSCDNPACVRWDKHLFLGTVGDNVRDMIDKGRAHRQDEEYNNYVKLNRQQVIEILDDTESTQSEKAAKYGVSQGAICDILMGKTWTSIPRTKQYRTNGYGRITQDNVIFIRSHPEISGVELCKKFNVVSSCISNIRNYKTWKNVTV